MEISLDTFLISDTHFGQDSVILRERIRTQIASHLGYKNHFDLLVDNWNSCVGQGDFVLHLGDVYFGGGLKYIKKLQGKKRLIIGNNDTKRFENLRSLGWKAKNKVALKIPQKNAVREKIAKKYGMVANSIYLNALVCDIAGERIMFSHFPVFERKKNDRFCAVRDVLDDYYRLCECSLNIHGHTHSRASKHSFCINVSCERTMLGPIALKKALKMVR